MLAVVTGGSGSGKSAYAEKLTASLHEKNHRTGGLIYLATLARGSGGDTEARIARHRRQRESFGFRTAERENDLAGLSLPENAAVLLEDLPNLLANEMWRPAGGQAAGPNADPGTAGRREDTDGRLIRRITSPLMTAAASGDLVVVTGRVSSDGIPYDPETVHYIRLLNAVTRILSAEADLMVLSAAGIPVILKDIRGISGKVVIPEDPQLRRARDSKRPAAPEDAAGVSGNPSFRT